jgi:hypothetical protein
MDFSKLSSFERMAAWAGIVVVVTGIAANLISDWGDLYWLAIVAAAVTVVVVFLPQFSPSTKLPGSSGSFLLLLGGIAGAAAVIYFITWIRYIFKYITDVDTILFLVGAVASVYLAWNGWRALQAEGGKFQFGTGSTGASPSAAPSAPEASAPDSSAPMASPPAEPMAESTGEASEEHPPS